MLPAHRELAELPAAFVYAAWLWVLTSLVPLDPSISSMEVAIVVYWWKLRLRTNTCPG